MGFRCKWTNFSIVFIYFKIYVTLFCTKFSGTLAIIYHRVSHKLYECLDNLSSSCKRYYHFFRVCLGVSQSFRTRKSVPGNCEIRRFCRENYRSLVYKKLKSQFLESRKIASFDFGKQYFSHNRCGGYY